MYTVMVEVVVMRLPHIMQSRHKATLMKEANLESYRSR